MKLYKYLALISLFGFLALPAHAQNERDALRHSYFGITGTARAQGMAGAYSAVGADLTSATLNPAGLGLYRGSSFTISPGFSNIQTESNFLDQSNKERLSSFYAPNMGVVFHGKNYTDNGRRKTEKTRGLKSFAFGMGFNQLERYDRQIDVTAFNTESSITDMFAQRANSRNVDPDNLPLDSYEDLAYRVLAIELLANSGTQYFPAVNGGDIQQNLQLSEEGYRNEWFLSLAGNIDDFLYIGATLGLQTVRYEQTLYFQEDDVDNVHQFFEDDPNSAFPLETPVNQIRFRDNFSTRGTGINAQVGIIIRPIDQLRIGVSVKSPTYLNLRDQFNTEIGHAYTIELDNGNLGEEDLSLSPELPGEFNYNLNTPFKATAGLMYLFGKNGFLSADVDFTDYTTARLSAQGDDFFIENNRIEAFYKAVLNYRVGGEYRLGILRVRGGVALYGDPLEDVAKEYLTYPDFSTSQIAGDRKIFTLGLGVRQPNYFFDVSFINQQQEDKFSPYSIESTDLFSPTAANNTTRSSVLMTLGFNF